MAFVKGREGVSRLLRQRIPEALEKKILRGAAQAAGDVIADEARVRSASSDVRNGIVVKARHGDGLVKVVVTVKKGWARAVGTWLEYGTSPHFISVDDSQRGGMSVGKVNRERSLMIGGKFVGSTVRHPGARPHPFLRPALDTKQGEAIAAAQNYINSRLARQGLGGAEEPERTDA